VKGNDFNQICRDVVLFGCFCQCRCRFFSFSCCRFVSATATASASNWIFIKRRTSWQVGINRTKTETATRAQKTGAVQTKRSTFKQNVAIWNKLKCILFGCADGKRRALKAGTKDLHIFASSFFALLQSLLAVGKHLAWVKMRRIQMGR